MVSNSFADNENLFDDFQEIDTERERTVAKIITVCDETIATFLAELGAATLQVKCFYNVTE